MGLRKNGRGLHFPCECVSVQRGYSDPWAAITQNKLLRQVANPKWAEAIGPDGDSVTIEELGEYVRESLARFCPGRYEVEAVRAMVKSEMESVERLDVPMVVDVGVGDNWRDAK